MTNDSGPKNTFIVIVFWISSFGLVACCANAANRSAESSVREKEGTPVVMAQGEIRKIDFKNYAYPVTCETAEFLGARGTVELSNGSSPQLRDKAGKAPGFALAFESVTYLDVDGNAKDEEAVVVLSVESRGSAMNNVVYIFGMENGSPRLLWSFDTGDRSHGGLRQVYSDDGNLVVERYNNDVKRAHNASVQTGGACCASTFTKATYQWTGLEYQLISAESKLNPGGSASRVN